MQAYFYATVAHSLSGQQMTISTNRESDRFMLRLPDGMRDRIKVAAESNNRSMNAEIVATLEEKYPPDHDAELRGLLDYVDTMDEATKQRFVAWLKAKVKEERPPSNLEKLAPAPTKKPR